MLAIWLDFARQTRADQDSTHKLCKGTVGETGSDEYLDFQRNDGCIDRCGFCMNSGVTGGFDAWL